MVNSFQNLASLFLSILFFILSFYLYARFKKNNDERAKTWFGIPLNSIASTTNVLAIICFAQAGANLTDLLIVGTVIALIKKAAFILACLSLLLLRFYLYWEDRQLSLAIEQKNKFKDKINEQSKTNNQSINEGYREEASKFSRWIDFKWALKKDYETQKDRSRAAIKHNSTKIKNSIFNRPAIPHAKHLSQKRIASKRHSNK